MKNLGTVGNQDLCFFTRFLPTEVRACQGVGIPVKIDLRVISKRLNIEYGFVYRPSRADLIRNDLFSYYQICRDIEGKPWHIFELDGGWGGKASEERLRESLDLATHEALWKRFPISKDYWYEFDTTPIVPLYLVPSYASKDAVELEYPQLDFNDLIKLNRKSGYPIMKAYEYGSSTSKARPRVYRKELAHLLSMDVVDPNRKYSVHEIIELCKKHSIYDIYPYCISPKGRALLQAGSL